jgi:peptidoglycan/xylan/chitin deacetylase (PgdA/CDA1 family)
MVVANLRQAGRALAIGALSLRKLGAKLQPGIRFVCYHDVLPGETASLEAQLLLMREQGEFIDLDRAIGLMEARSVLDRPLFTVTFDDGLVTTCGEAWPVFERLGIPLSIFIITSLVGQPGYMSWDDIAAMAKSPLVTFGSHTVNHRNLMSLSADEVRLELTQSKAEIEAALNRRCDHFCCPWGRPDRDFRSDRDPQIAMEVGYRSFLTTQRGLTRTGDKLPLVKRDVIHMHSSRAELRHFLF